VGSSRNKTKSRPSVVTDDQRQPAAAVTSRHNHYTVAQQDVHLHSRTATDFHVDASTPVAPRRTKRERRENGRRSPRQQDSDVNGRHHSDVSNDVQNDDWRDRTINGLTSVDENDNLMSAAETNDVTDYETTTDYDESYQKCKTKISLSFITFVKEEVFSFC